MPHTTQQTPPANRGRRLFLALPLPHEFAIQLSAPANLPRGIRWTRAGQAHVTLRFVGEVDDEVVAALQSRLATIHTPTFQMVVTRTGCFPNCRRPRVLWLGLEAHPAVVVLREAVEAAVVVCGLPRDPQPFVPHITLARVKRPPRGGVGPWLTPFDALAGAVLPVDYFCLYASVLEPAGARYEVVQRYELV